MTNYLFAYTRNSIWRKIISGRITFKKDGDEFRREMHTMQKFAFHPDDCVMVECRKKPYWARRKEFLTGLKKIKDVDTLALFCHGSKHWIFGIGYNRKNIDFLAQPIANNIIGRVHIILYACSCGKGKGNIYPIGEVPVKAGVAMMLADELAKKNINFRIIAHTKKGHTTMCPNSVFIESDSTHVYKRVVVKRVTRWQGKKDPVGRKRWLEWIKRLRTNRYWRFKYPYRDIPQIHAMLEGEPY